jgi:signal peptidase I
MVHTLEMGDRICVDEITFGPELLPGFVKFPGFREVKRGDIAIFESPEYESKGTVNDIITRIVYMMTFSFVDLDRDESGEPAKHFLIKRVPVVAGDRMRMNKGFMEVRPPGFSAWQPEEELKKSAGLSYALNVRMIKDFKYKGYNEAAEGFALLESGLPVDQDQEAALRTTFFMMPAGNTEELTRVTREINYRTSVYLTIENESSYEVWGIAENFDHVYLEKMRYRALSQINPHDTYAKKEYLKHEAGRYIPPGYIFPMGDNRDNSRDARIFGPVKTKKVLGKSFFRFFPFSRLGGI